MKSRGLQSFTGGVAGHRGLTLIELMVTIAVLVILLMIAVPSFQRTIDSRRLMGVADNLMADLRFAQSESVKRNANVTLTFTAVGTDWAYDVESLSTRSVSHAQYAIKAVTVNTTDNTITFNPKRGTITEADPLSAYVAVEIESRLGQRVGIELNPASQWRLCTSTAFANYPTCPGT